VIIKNDKQMENKTSGLSAKNGHIHPLTRVINDVMRIFVDMDFEISEGMEIETEYYNFDALNVSKDHTARDMQDTFWIKDRDDLVLRTHTSPVQIHYMEKNRPPFKIIVPGKVFRNEATDATHEAQFHQIEGLVVGEKVTLAQLKGTLEVFLKKLFGENIKIKLRPGYFPFVEPGVEIDMLCFKCEGGGCTACKQSGWIEILGAGMVHPNVLNNIGIDSRKYTGFAFGVGVDRLAMIKYGIDDIRTLYSGDLRVVNQF